MGEERDKKVKEWGMEERESDGEEEEKEENDERKERRGPDRRDEVKFGTRRHYSLPNRATNPPEPLCGPC